MSINRFPIPQSRLHALKLLEREKGYSGRPNPNKFEMFLGAMLACSDEEFAKYTGTYANIMCNLCDLNYRPQDCDNCNKFWFRDMLYFLFDEPWNEHRKKIVKRRKQK